MNSNSLSLAEQFRLIELMQQGQYQTISPPYPESITDVDQEFLLHAEEDIKFQRKWLTKFLEQYMLLTPQSRQDLGSLLQHYTVEKVGIQLKKIKREIAKKSWFSRLFASKLPLSEKEYEHWLRLQQELNLGGKGDFKVKTNLHHRMSYIPCGSFDMGTSAVDAQAVENEKPQHRVYITAPFWMGEGPVSQNLFSEVMGYNPSSQRQPDAPVDQVSWFEALLFCNTLSDLAHLEPVYGIPESIQKKCSLKTTQKQLEKCYPRLNEIKINAHAQGYRLPTEAEWEYAAKANQKNIYAGSDNIDSVAWFGDNSRDRLQPIGLKAANAFGLRDMSGNVWEWCWDGFDEELYTKKRQPYCVDLFSQNPTFRRACRGGSYYSNAQKARTVFRQVGSAAERSMGQGFRIVRNIGLRHSAITIEELYLALRKGMLD